MQLFLHDLGSRRVTELVFTPVYACVRVFCFAAAVEQECDSSFLYFIMFPSYELPGAEHSFFLSFWKDFVVRKGNSLPFSYDTKVINTFLQFVSLN